MSHFNIHVNLVIDVSFCLKLFCPYRYILVYIEVSCNLHVQHLPRHMIWYSALFQHIVNIFVRRPVPKKWVKRTHLSVAKMTTWWLLSQTHYYGFHGYIEFTEHLMTGKLVGFLSVYALKWQVTVDKYNNYWINYYRGQYVSIYDCGLYNISWIPML